MTRPIQIILDRLADAIEQTLHVKPSRSQTLQIAAFAFGYHNSNEMTAAAKAGRLTPPAATLIGYIAETDTTPQLTVLKDNIAHAIYALETSFITNIAEDTRREQFGVTPYGHQADLRTILSSDSDGPQIDTQIDETTASLARSLAANAQVPQSILEDEKKIASSETTLSATFSAEIEIDSPVKLFRDALAHYLLSQVKNIEKTEHRHAIMKNSVTDGLSFITNTEAALTQVMDRCTNPDGACIQGSESDAMYHLL